MDILINLSLSLSLYTKISMDKSVWADAHKAEGDGEKVDLGGVKSVDERILSLLQDDLWRRQRIFAAQFFCSLKEGNLLLVSFLPYLWRTANFKERF